MHSLLTMISCCIFKLLLWFCFYIRLYQFSPQCLDQNGDPVDWFVIYKLPRIENSTDAKIAAGVGYSFITSETVNASWQFADHNITDSKSLPGRTLSPAYLEKNNNNVKDIFWLLYNDQPPSESFDAIHAHAKGIILGDEVGGIWIIHSVPHFPSIDDLGYRYPQTGQMYGQTFLCVSLNKENLNEVGNQLMVNWVYVYDHKLNGNFSTIYPNLSIVAQMKQIQTVQRKTVLTSVENVQFTSFAKSSKFKKDLYSKWVAQVLRAELFVETWLHEFRLPSDCSGHFEVHNIKEISITGSHCQFHNGKDHSKFAVSGDINNPWFCIGDINRSRDQFKRGGGAVCLRNTNLWLSYHQIVADFEPCPKKM